jgi:hypothetical protein
MDTGERVEINGAEVSVDIMNEVLDHYSMASGEVRKVSRAINQNRKVNITTRDSEAGEGLIRLIREN